MKDLNKLQRWSEVGIILATFILYFSLSCFLPVDKAPDEYMRYDVAEYIFEHHELPIGSAEEIRNPIWGFSYAFTPYLPSMLAAGIMQIVSLFGGSGTVLIIASRLISVLSATGSTWLGLAIGRKLFPKWSSGLLYTLSIGVLPQFVFLSAYLNNDAPAVFASMLILFSWILGKEKHWDYKSCILLGVGISVCALTYYNAYGWILCSIIYFCITVLADKTLQNRWKYLLLHGGTVALTVFVLAGWFFVRNAVLYDGDFLGMKASKICGELYGQEAYKPSNRATFQNQGKSIRDMLNETDWIESSKKSFFAVFGYMNIYVSEKYYTFYTILIRLGLAGFLLGCIQKKAKGQQLLYACCILCFVLPVVLSAINAYSSDYQAQGRYFMPGLPALVLLTTKGYQWLEEAVGLKKPICTLFVCAAWLASFANLFVKVMLPQLYVGI
ncbi:MAG: ArnT family glycosyltransferase [Lachnospiraceae bacterium]